MGVLGIGTCGEEDLLVRLRELNVECRHEGVTKIVTCRHQTKRNLEIEIFVLHC